MTNGDTDVPRVVESMVSNWPLEHLVIRSMRSEVICAHLGRARTKSLRTFELRSQLKPADQPFNGFTNIVSSLHSLGSLEKVVFLLDEFIAVDPSANARSPVIRWENIKHLSVSRKLFDVFRLAPAGFRLPQIYAFPPNLTDLEMHCGHHSITTFFYMDRSPLEKWSINFATALKHQQPLGYLQHLRSIILLLGSQRRQESFDFGELMEVCKYLRIHLNCKDLDTGVAYGIKRLSRA